MTENEQDKSEYERPGMHEYPGVVKRYYRDHPYFASFQIIMGLLTGGTWLVGYFIVSAVLFWAGEKDLEEYRR